MAELGRRGGRHDRFNGVSGRFGPTYGVYRQIGPRATPSQRCRGAGTAPVVPGQPPQPHTARHSRRSVRDARNDYRCARATARAWAQCRGPASAESWRGGRPVRSGRRPTQERSPRRAGPRPIWTPSAPPYRAPLPRLGATPAAKFPQSGAQRRSDTLGGAWHHPGSVLMPPANLGVSDPNSAGGPEGAGPPTPPATPPAPLRAHTAGPAAPPLQRSNVTAPLAGPLRAPSHPTARPTSIRRDPPPPRPLPASQSWHWRPAAAGAPNPRQRHVFAHLRGIGGPPAKMSRKCRVCRAVGTPSRHLAGTREDVAETSVEPRC